MPLAFLDTQPGRQRRAAPPAVALLPAALYQAQAGAAYEDAALLLAAILPDARIEHVGASAVPGACSKGGVDVCVAVTRAAFDEALCVLVDAGFTVREEALRTPQICMLDAPASPVPLSVQLIEAGSRFEFFMRFRDALRRDGVLRARYDAIRLAAAPGGWEAYRRAKSAFIERVVGR